MSTSDTKAANAVVANPVQSALDALKGGKDVEQSVYGTSTPSNSVEGGSSEGVEATGDMLDAVADGSEGTDENQGSEAEASEPSLMDELVPSKDTAKAAAPKKDVEEIIITDESGRKKITLDWNNRAQIKKYVEQAAGMRKFQAERDKTATKLKEIEPKFKELSDSWQAVEQAYSKESVKGLVNLLANDPKGFDQWMDREYQKRRHFEDASPSEKSRLELEEKLAAATKRTEQFEKQITQSLQKAEEERLTASQKALESQIHPAFDKYRFAGKLGDETVEHQLDSAVWTQTLARLEQYPDSAELNSAIIDKEFRTVANTFRKIIAKQADNTAKKVIAQKKEEAQTTVAKKVQAGMKNSTAVDSFKSDMKSGNLVSALTAYMTGKVKL